MTKKNQNKQKSTAKPNARIKQLEQQLAQVKIKAKTPFSTAGALVGARAGQMFNLPMLKGVGRWLGGGIGSIFGSGDYTMSGQQPEFNVLTNGSQIPKFSTTHATNVVCHREYLGDIAGTSAFNNTAYPINPGLSSTFPWLSTIADNYQEYKIHGMIFEFRPLITDFVTGGAPGVIVLATNYNADLPVYTTKQQMENSEFAVSVKPTLPLIHGIECSAAQTDPIIKYVRNSSLASGQDLKNYDWGTFQFATQSNPIQNLGELWVSYCVEFFKPVLTSTTSTVVVASTHKGIASVTAANPLGLVQTSISGALGATATATVISIPSTTIGSRFILTMWWQGSSGAYAPPTITTSNATDLNFNAISGARSSTPSVSTTMSSMQITYTFSVTATGPVTITLSGTGTFGASCTGDIWINPIDSTVTA